MIAAIGRTDEGAASVEVGDDGLAEVVAASVVVSGICVCVCVCECVRVYVCIMC